MTLLLKSIQANKMAQSGGPGVSTSLSETPSTSLNPTARYFDKNEINKNKNGDENGNGNITSLNSTISARTNAITIASVSTCEYNQYESFKNTVLGSRYHMEETGTGTGTTTLESLEGCIRNEMEAEARRQKQSDEIKYKQNKIIDRGNDNNHYWMMF